MAVSYSHYLMPQKTNTSPSAVLQGTSTFKAGQSIPYMIVMVTHGCKQVIYKIMLWSKNINFHTSALHNVRLRTNMMRYEQMIVSPPVLSIWHIP